MDIAADFAVTVNDTFIASIMPTILRNLMLNGNVFVINGVQHRATVDMVFEGGVPHMNGSLISADNVTARMLTVLSTGFLVNCTLYSSRNNII